MAVSEDAAKAFEFLRLRKRNYQLAWCNQPAVQEMLIDLMRFCRANETCVVLDNNGRVDKDRSLILEGRREAIMRILDHINLPTAKLYALYTGKQFNPGDE